MYGNSDNESNGANDQVYGGYDGASDTGTSMGKSSKQTLRLERRIMTNGLRFVDKDGCIDDTGNWFA